MADNILDDVDEILGSVEEDKNFNESELQDIMSEIEDLEKEFEAVVEETPVMSLQEKIDAELAAELEEIATAEIISEVEAELDAELEEVMMDEIIAEEVPAQVLAFEKPAPVATTPVTTAAPTFTKSSSKSEVSFAAQGQMSLNLDFKVGSETAKLSVDPVLGLTVTLNGVVLCINEETGCTVSMDNGMKFNIPLSSETISSKKKSA